VTKENGDLSLVLANSWSGILNAGDSTSLSNSSGSLAAIVYRFVVSSRWLLFGFVAQANHRAALTFTRTNVASKNAAQAISPPRNILDYLYNCPTSLKNCSRVCRAWLATSRFHLFYHISFVLNGRGASNRFQRLHSVIEQSPIIALYIRELVILRNSKLPDSEWPKLGMVVPLLFGKLASLQKLDVRGFNWSRLTPDARSSVRTLLALPSLVHLALMHAILRQMTCLIAGFGVHPEATPGNLELSKGVLFWKRWDSSSSDSTITNFARA
jgi:hypothetical protein